MDEPTAAADPLAPSGRCDADIDSEPSQYGRLIRELDTLKALLLEHDAQYQADGNYRVSPEALAQIARTRLLALRADRG